MKKRIAKKGIVVTMAAVMGISACVACGTQAPTETPVTTEAEAAEEVTETTSSAVGAPTDYVEDTVLSTDLITMTVPDEFKGKFYAKIDGEEISIYDKECVDDGFPGYAFSVVADKDKKYVPGGMYIKVGELLTADGEFVNVLIGFASEVQWDYEKYEDVPENYAKLEDSAESFIEGIEGVNGNTFYNKGGTKGEDLYYSSLSKYVTAFAEGWDANKFEEEGLSPEFYAMYKNEGEKALDKIGYAYMDISNDGVDELLVGVITDDEASVVYDIYTVVDRFPAQVVSGTAKNGYHVLSYGGFVNFFNNGAEENGVYDYIIEPASTNLTFQFGLKYDAYTDEKNPWFVSYSDEDNWEAMSEEDYNSRNAMLAEQYVKLDFVPFSEMTPIDYSKVDTSKYGTFTEMLGDFKTGMGYANEKLGDTDVFLASTATYNWDGNEYAIDSSVFMYEDGNIKYLGVLESAGTAYPLAIADGCIFTCAHHYIAKSTVKDGKLVKVEEAEENFDASGNASYMYGTDEEKLHAADDDSDFIRLFEEYEKAQPINYSVEKR